MCSFKIAKFGGVLLSLPKEHSVRKPEKFILDATAGFRMMWFNKHHPNTIYLDQRPECEPDIVGDFRHLEQFEDGIFNLIVWDPPHRTLTGVPKNFWIMHHYGGLNPETWQHDLTKGFNELWRVLKPYGILIFKWTDDHIKLHRVFPLFPVKPLFGQTTASTAKASTTQWFCFMKIPKEEGAK